MENKNLLPVIFFFPLWLSPKSSFILFARACTRVRQSSPTGRTITHNWMNNLDRMHFPQQQFLGKEMMTYLFFFFLSC